MYGRRVSERAVAGALRFFVKIPFLCFSVACYPDRLVWALALFSTVIVNSGRNQQRWWLSGWSNDAVVWRFLGVVKLTCQFKFRFREVGASSALPLPAFVSGEWRLSQSYAAGFRFFNLFDRVGFVFVSGSGVVFGSWLLWFAASICWMRSRFNQWSSPTLR